MDTLVIYGHENKLNGGSSNPIKKDHFQNMMMNQWMSYGL